MCVHAYALCSQAEAERVAANAKQPIGLYCVDTDEEGRRGGAEARNFVTKKKHDNTMRFISTALCR
jgi:hypothetical protein